MPGVWISSASSSPAGTNSSTSAMVILPSGCHHWVEVPCGLTKDQVAVSIAFPRFDNREISHEASFHDAVDAIEVAGLFSVCDDRSETGRREECWDTSATSANTLGQRSLWDQLNFEFAAQELGFEGLVFADIARDHLFDLLGFEEKAKTFPVNPTVVGDDGELVHAFGVNRSESGLRGYRRGRSHRS